MTFIDGRFGSLGWQLNDMLRSTFTIMVTARLLTVEPWLEISGRAMWIWVHQWNNRSFVPLGTILRSIVVAD
jgi:hypothetical protein